MSTFPLRIGTPDGLLFEGEAERVICRSITGDLAILARHCNFCTALGMGEASVVMADGSMAFQNSGFSMHYGGLAVSGSPANYASGKDSAKDYITCTANGFLVKSFTRSDVVVNSSPSVYNYVAIKTGG